MTRPRIRVDSLYWEDKEKPWRFRLVEDVEVILSNGTPIRIPAGFITDFRSAPNNPVTRALVNVAVEQCGNHNLATLIHDWLYVNKYISRKFADKEMLYWLLLDCSKTKSYAMYHAVRTRGQSWWDSQ